MSFRRLGNSRPAGIDPIAEARRVFVGLGLNALSSEAIVFGSAADGTFSAHSDIDVLVIFENSKNLKEGNAVLLQRPLSEWPFDWVFKLRDDYERRSELGGVCYIAKRQGVRIHEPAKTAF